MQLTQSEILQIPRKRSGMNQGEFGARAFNVSTKSGRTKIKNIELGKQTPTPDDLEKMAFMLGVPVSVLVGDGSVRPSEKAADGEREIHGTVLDYFPGLDAYLDLLSKATRLGDDELLEKPQPLAWQQAFMSTFVVGFALFFFTAFQGMGARLLEVGGVETFQNLGSDMVVPTLTKEFLPPVFLGIVFIGAIAAIQSTAAPYIGTGGSILLRDVYFRHIKKGKAGDSEQIWVNRLLATALTIAISATGLVVILGALAQSDEDRRALVVSVRHRTGLHSWQQSLLICRFSPPLELADRVVDSRHRDDVGVVFQSGNGHDQ